jgi:transcriptional regulator with XRE-family HTH domain
VRLNNFLNIEIQKQHIMTEQIRLIVERIKGIREIAGISAESLANDLSMTKEQYLKYESGNVDIPVSLLYKIAQRINIDLSVLLSGENPKLHVYCVVRDGKGLRVERNKRHKYESLAFNFVNKKAEPFMIIIEPENDDTKQELTSHPGQEFDYVIEGCLMVNIDDHEVILNEGDSIYFDSTYKHSLRALNNKKVKLLAVAI